MPQYSTGPRHARLRPYRGRTLPATILVLEILALAVLLVVFL